MLNRNRKPTFPVSCTSDPYGRGAQHDVIFGAFEFQGIARADLQRVAHRLGQDDAARFIDGQSGIHNAILP